jgi:endonuclease YncB( thermonuclease family)
MRRWWVAALMALLLLVAAAGADAAEVLQVRSGSLLQVGDHNRTYTVELACVAVPEGGEQAAADWLRSTLPRRTRVNLRPIGNDNGTLIARVQRLGPAASEDTADLSDGLVSAGLATALPSC